jgi:hypothetical protein
MARFPRSDKSTVNLSEILSGQGSKADSNLAENSTLGGLLQHAARLTQLQQRLTAALDPALAAHFQVANLKQNRLVLLASSPAWATRLRMQAADVLAILRRSGLPELIEVEVRVAPLTAPPAPQPGRKALSPAAEQALALMARLRAEERNDDEE